MLHESGGSVARTGRPNAYDSVIKPNLDKIKSWRQSGETWKQIAQRLGVAESVLYAHKNNITEFSDIVKKADEEMITDIENKAYQAAMGGIKTTRTKQTLVNGVMTVVEIVEEYTLPNPTMMIFMLKAHKPDVYMNAEPDNNTDVVKSIERLADKLTRK